MRKTKILYVFTFVLISFFSLAFAVTYNLGFSPLKTEIEMYPGEVREYDMTLSNDTISVIDYQLEIGSFKLDSDGQYVYSDSVTSGETFYDFSAANWVEFETDSDHVFVDPLKNVKIKVKVAVPRNIKYGGDYYAMLWANFVPPNQNKSLAGNATGSVLSVERRFKFGSLLHITVKGRPSKSQFKIDKIDIVNFDLLATSDVRGLEIDTYVDNLGDTSYRPTGDYLIVSPDNKVWGRGSLEMNRTDLVMPHLSRKMYALYDRSLPSGNYTVRINVKEGNRYLDHKEYDFTITQSTATAKLLGINLKVDPSDVVTDGRSGTNEMQKLTVENREFTTITATLSAVSIGMKENGDFVFGTSPLKEIKFYPTSFNLRENQKRTVPFSYKIPPDSEGQYVFAAKVDASLENSKANSSGFYIPVLTRINGTTNYSFKLEKTEKIITAESTQSGSATAVLRLYIKNTSNTFTNLNIAYDIIDPNANYLTAQAKYLSQNGFTILSNISRYVDIPIGGYNFRFTGTYRMPFLLLYKGDKNVQEQINMEIEFDLNEEDLQKIKTVEGAI